MRWVAYVHQKLLHRHKLIVFASSRFEHKDLVWVVRIADALSFKEVVVNVWSFNRKVVDVRRHFVSGYLLFEGLYIYWGHLSTEVFFPVSLGT